MAPQMHQESNGSQSGRRHVCSIIPVTLLQEILNNQETSAPTRAAVQKTFNHVCKLQQARIARDHHHAPSHGIRTETATSELYRVLYTSAKTDTINKTLLFEEGADVATVSKDQNASEVYDFFGKTYKFYEEVFQRNSIDDKGLHLVGSVHYDDEPGPPGMDNAFWDGKEMAFGDGDGDIFGSFTKNLDVIGHELTHGVTENTAGLEYEYQSGALNESMSDVFGSMIKQYFGGTDGQTKVSAADADWLIGEGIFLPSVTNAKALRSMKAPGTAYNNPKVGKDPQPKDMDGYKKLPLSDAGDWGGVHTNSGIPNRAFYLVATGLGGYSWEKAGPIWYAALLDPKLKGVNTKKAFTIFADLTVKYALDLYDEETQTVVKGAWETVKVLKATAPKPEDPKQEPPAKGEL